MKNAMKRFFPLMLCALVTVLSASKCEKYDPDVYRDSAGNKVTLVGKWGLTKVEYRTGGVTESRAVTPTTLTEFLHGDKARTLSILKDGTEEVSATFHYETFRGAVTFYTDEEWENNRSLGEDDSNYERGKTYYYKVTDGNNIYYEEKVTEGTTLVNHFTRF